MNDLTPRQQDAQLRLHALLAELAPVIGPADDGQTEAELLEAPTGAVTLREWATVGFWVDETGERFYTVLPGAGMEHHHTRGLLAAGLDYVGGYDGTGQ